MCGIVGYIGKKQAAPVLLEGLKRLEYRGYDSAGIAVSDGRRTVVEKRAGRVDSLSYAAALSGNVGIGHTRWATHGAPSERNAHPHAVGRVILVHNGIIENADELKSKLNNVAFSSDTDSEVAAALFDREYRGDPFSAFFRIREKLSGSYAFAVMFSDRSDLIFAAKNKSPLVVGVGDGECYVASDYPALAGKKLTYYLPDDGEAVLLTENGATFLDKKGRIVEKKPVLFSWEEAEPQRMGYHHFMRKEIDEIPAAVQNSLVDFCSVPEFSLFCKVLCETKSIHIVACGTAYHSGLAAKYALEKLVRLRTEVFIASEYRYMQPILDRNTLVIAVSQSGETADTIAAVELVKRCGVTAVAVTNVTCSTLAGICDFVLPSKAGPEVAVAATKSYNAQLCVLYSIVLALYRLKGGQWSEKQEIFSNGDRTPFSDGEGSPLSKVGRAELSDGDGKAQRTPSKRALQLKQSLFSLPELARRALKSAEGVRKWVNYFLTAKSVYFIGRGTDCAVAKEGSLKLKEITYLPGEGYAAGELKHGTLALIEKNTPVVAILTEPSLVKKTVNAIREVQTRGARVFLVTNVAAPVPDGVLCVRLPRCEPCFSPVLSVIPLQMLAYYSALALGNDPDKPRNLAKSVTVE